MPNFQIDRDKFFKGYRDSFGSLIQSEVDGLNLLLGFIENDPANKRTNSSRKKIAYMLATVKHETHNPITGDTFNPIDEIGSNAYFNNRYGEHTNVGKNLGNMMTNDGARFHGRGYVQLTGRNNYIRARDKFKVDFVAYPDKVKEPQFAYEILSAGMREGWFTNRRLSEFITESATDYLNARRIVNGTDEADRIAAYAKLFDQILSFSIVPSTEPIAHTSEISVSPDPPLAGVAPSDEWIGGSAFVDPETNADKTVSVPQVSAEREPPKETKGLGASIAAAVTFLTTTGAGLLSWLAGTRTELIYALFGGAAVVGVVFIVTRFNYANKEKQRAHDEKMQRERQAFEVQLAIINSAARKDLNTVHVVPTPLKNSDG